MLTLHYDTPRLQTTSYATYISKVVTAEALFGPSYIGIPTILEVLHSFNVYTIFDVLSYEAFFYFLWPS